MDSIARWDEWFNATRDEESARAWADAKKVFAASPVLLERWAVIIELNRIDMATKNNHEPKG